VDDALFETVATKADLNEAVATLDRKIEVEAAKLDRKIDAFDRKIEVTARDLTIKGAGGLAIIASIIIGLKLFG
jgi:phosphate uptake regulator